MPAAADPCLYLHPCCPYPGHQLVQGSHNPRCCQRQSSTAELGHHQTHAASAAHTAV
jgi:hypothetical protein